MGSVIYSLATIAKSSQPSRLLFGDKGNIGKCLLAFLVAIYALGVVGLAVFQRRLLYFPDRRLTHPAEAGMNGVEELRVKADDGETLVTWHLPPGTDTRSYCISMVMAARWSTAFRVFACLPRAGTGFSPCPIVAMVARPDRQRKRV